MDAFYLQRKYFHLYNIRFFSPMCRHGSVFQMHRVHFHNSKAKIEAH